jgi:hypothetical protein
MAFADNIRKSVGETKRGTKKLQLSVTSFYLCFSGVVLAKKFTLQLLFPVMVEIWQLLKSGPEVLAMGPFEYIVTKKQKYSFKSTQVVKNAFNESTYPD